MYGTFPYNEEEELKLKQLELEPQVPRGIYPQEAPAPVSVPPGLQPQQKEDLYAVLQAKYDAESKTASDRADKLNMVAGIGSALEGLARSTARDPKIMNERSGIYDSLRQEGQQGKADADAKKKQAVEAYLTNKHMVREDKEYERQDSLRSQEDDSNSELSKSYADLATELNPKGNYKGMSGTQIKEFIPNVEKLAAIRVKKREGSAGNAGDWQILNLDDGQGHTKIVNFNKLTREQYEIPGYKGYAPHVVTDPITGAIMQLRPGQGPIGTGTSGSPVGGSSGGNGGNGGSNSNQSRDGRDGRDGRDSAPGTVNVTSSTGYPAGSPNDIKAKAEIKATGAKTAINNHEKDKDALQEAQSAQGARSALTNRLTGLYDKASKGTVGGTGLIGGALTQAMTAMHLSNGPDADELNVALGTELADYIHKISGSAASEAEVARLKALTPSILDSKDLFANKLRAAMIYADSVVNEKRSKVGLKPVGETKTGGVVERRDSKTGKVAIFDAETKQFIKYKGE